MIIKRLRTKLLLSAVAISILVTLVTMLAVAWVIGQQYLDQSNAALSKASEIINDSLEEVRNNQLAASRQLTTQRNFGSTIWYLAKYARSNIDREMLFVTYQQLARDTRKIGHVAKLSKIAIYDSAGSLISFALFDKERELVGFVEHAPARLFKVASLKDGKELDRKNLQTMNAVDKMAFEFAGQFPRQERVHYAVIDGMLAIESHVPIMGEVFDPASGKQETKQLGLVVTVKPIAQDFANRLSRLTDSRINIFTTQGYSSGDLASYRNPDWSGALQVPAGKQGPAMAFNEILIGGEHFYQSLMPLYDGEQLVGTIAALRSGEIVSSNIREMMQILGMIALASLLFIFPFAWYFASSISRPLTVLSGIFRSVANGKQSDTLNAARHQLERDKKRDDELGDLTQSFMAMDDAVNQKIQQIREINASLEQTINERTAALAAREQESRTLLENSPDTIARYDRDHRRTYVNAAFGAMADGGIAALMGRTPTEFPGGPNAAIYEEKIGDVFASGENAQFELNWSGRDGKEICSHIRLTAERDATGDVTSVLAVGRDISELNNYRMELKNKDIAKSRFLAAAGHDLRQPLAAANLFLDTLKLTATTPDQDRLIQRLDMAMSTFNGLLDALLNVSKLDAGVIRPEITSIDVVEIFNWLEQSFAAMAVEKKIGFRLYFPLKERLFVSGDIGLIKSALMNFVSNAIKFTSKGAILISARRRGEDVLFQVWDTGIGIPAEYIGHIFEEFYQVSNPQRDRTRGLGLGLSIAKRAISLLDAEVRCRSHVGRGTVIEFRLPVTRTECEARSQVDTEPQPEVTNQLAFVRGKRFVVVEDDVLIAEALSTLLKGMGGEVECFHTAEDALNSINIEQADCYIVDYMLGGTLNGMEFLNMIHQKMGRPINAVLMTGDTSPAFMQKAAVLDCVWPVLHKPANVSRLIASLSTQLPA